MKKILKNMYYHLCLGPNWFPLHVFCVNWKKNHKGDIKICKILIQINKYPYSQFITCPVKKLLVCFENSECPD